MRRLGVGSCYLATSPMTHPLCYHAMDFYLNGLLSVALSTASKKNGCVWGKLYIVLVLVACLPSDQTKKVKWRC